VLERVDDVDWASLPGAYGPTDEVATMLRNTASEDEDVAFEALTWLDEQITY
jgi:hypothetical protein